MALTGPSGSGKTTLLSVLAGLAEPDSGTVLLDGRALADHGPQLRRRVGIVFQGYVLVALLTAAENVEMALVVTGLPAAQAAERAREALELVGLADRAEHLVEELSGGQQQRVAVARALAGRPDVLLADEPTAEQDPAHAAQALDAILAAADRGQPSCSPPTTPRRFAGATGGCTSSTGRSPTPRPSPDPQAKSVPQLLVGGGVGCGPGVPAVVVAGETSGVLTHHPSSLPTHSHPL